MNHIYYFYDKNKNLLYIGKTTALPQRMSAHFSKSIIESDSWKTEVDLTNIIIYKCSTKTDLDIYETYLINKLKPLYNKDKVFYDKSTLELPELKSTIYIYSPYKETRKLNLAFLEYIDLKDKELKTENDLLAIKNLELKFPYFIGDYSTDKKEEVLTDRMMLEDLNKLSEKYRYTYADRLSLGGTLIKFEPKTTKFNWR